MENPFSSSPTEKKISSKTSMVRLVVSMRWLRGMTGLNCM